MLLAGKRPLGCLFGVDADLDDVGHCRASFKASRLLFRCARYILYIAITTGNQPD